MNQKIMQKLSQIGNKTICPIAVFVKDGKVLCGMRHYASDKLKTIDVWTCPGGRCDENESIEETLRREIAEEIGITNFIFLQYIGEFHGAKEGDIVPLFLCKTTQSPKLMEPEKFSEWKWFAPEDLPENYINNEVKKVIINFLSN